MKQPILTEIQRTASRRQALAMLQSPAGRDWGRFLLMEKGREGGDMVQMERELLDILSDCIKGLYGSEAPKVYGATLR